MRQFNRVVVGDITNAMGNEEFLRRKGVKVDILEDQACIQLYNRYRRERPTLTSKIGRDSRPFIKGRNRIAGC